MDCNFRPLSDSRPLRRFCSLARLLAVLLCLAARSAVAQTVIFDFDTGTPTLRPGQSTPLSQTVSGITAQFTTSGIGGSFSVQSDATTQYSMSQFSGNYLWPNTLGPMILDIHFSRPLSAISLTFATADFQQVEVPTTVKLTAFVDATGTTPVGSATAHGTYANDTMPMGTLTFNSGGKPFNVVELSIPWQPLAAGDFLVDNIIVTPLPQAGSLAVTIAPGAAAAAGAGWRRVGTTAWHDSGTTETGIPPGPWAVEFKMLADWNTPATQNITISDGQTMQITGTYVHQVGSLKVTLLPAEAVAAGAQWRRQGTTPWLNSGATETGVPTGLVTLEFKTISGWAVPVGGVITILNGQTAQGTWRYALPTAVAWGNWAAYY